MGVKDEGQVSHTHTLGNPSSHSLSKPNITNLFLKPYKLKFRG